jgi:hypothetical protein
MTNGVLTLEEEEKLIAFAYGQCPPEIVWEISDKFYKLKTQREGGGQQ